MKVVLIAGEYPPLKGGVGDYTAMLGRALGQLGIDVHVITSGSDSGHNGGSDAPTVHPAVRSWSWRCLGTITGLLDVINPDVVHIQYQTASFGLQPAINCLPLWLALRRPQVCTAITYHDLRVPYLFPKAGRIRWWTTVAPALWSDAVVVTNPEDYGRLGPELKAGQRGIGIRDRILAWWGRRGSDGGVIRSPYLVPIGSNIAPNPPPGFDRTAWRAEIGARNDEALLVYFGFLNASKGGETLMRALQHLIQAGVRCRLLMLGEQVGSSDPTNAAYLARVKGLVEELGLADRVTWTGFLPKAAVSAYLLAADVAVLPYRDGASFRRGSLMAALAHGVPVVTTQPARHHVAPGFPELVDGVNARLVAPDDPHALAAAVRGLIASPGVRAELSQAAKALANAFRWDRIARQTQMMYSELLATT